MTEIPLNPTKPISYEISYWNPAPNQGVSWVGVSNEAWNYQGPPPTEAHGPSARGWSPGRVRRAHSLGLGGRVIFNMNVPWEFSMGGFLKWVVYHGKSHENPMGRFISWYWKITLKSMGWNRWDPGDRWELGQKNPSGKDSTECSSL